MVRKLQHEIRQSQPFASLEEEAMLNLARTADRMQSSVRQMLKPFGLTPNQYNVLRILRGAGPGGLTCTELGERLISEDPDITRLLDRLAKQHLVRRRRNEGDRRVVYTEISPEGLEKLRLLDPLVTEGVQDRMKHMSQERLALLIDLLEDARQAGSPGPSS
jgi:DNA-binding MarR family transcriptional regulator